MRALRLGGPEAHETASARLKAALEIDGSIWEAWHDLGVIAWKDGEDDEAIDAFTKALADNREHTPTAARRAPRRIAAPVTRRKRAATTRPR